jgi:hypothetical protein
VLAPAKSPMSTKYFTGLSSLLLFRVKCMSVQSRVVCRTFWSDKQAANESQAGCLIRVRYSVKVRSERAQNK